MEADNEAQRRKLEKFTDELSHEFSALRATYNEVSRILIYKLCKIIYRNFPLKKRDVTYPHFPILDGMHK